MEQRARRPLGSTRIIEAGKTPSGHYSPHDLDEKFAGFGDHSKIGEILMSVGEPITAARVADFADMNEAAARKALNSMEGVKKYPGDKYWHQ